MQTRRTVFSDGQRAVGGDAGDADADPDIESALSGNRKTRAAGTTVYSWAVPLAGRPSPASVTQTRSPTLKLTTPVAELVDDSGAVLVRHRGFGERAAGCATARLPVGRVHARDEHADPHLAF
jgi:hypothetical protein